MAGGYLENEKFTKDTWIYKAEGIKEFTPGTLTATFYYGEGESWRSWKEYIEEAQVCWNYWMAYENTSVYNPELTNGIQSVDVNSFQGGQFNTQFDVPAGAVWVACWARLKWKSYTVKQGNNTITKYYGGDEIGQGAEVSWYRATDWTLNRDSWPKLPPDPTYTLKYDKLNVTFTDIRPLSPDGLAHANDLIVQLWTHNRVEETKYVQVWSGNHYDPGYMDDDQLNYNFNTSARVSFDVKPGNEYYIRATSVRYGDGYAPLNNKKNNPWYPLSSAGEISWTNWVPDGENGIITRPSKITYSDVYVMSSDSVRLTWNVADLADYYKITYATELAYLDSNVATTVTTEDLEYPLDHTFVLGNLESGRTYYYKISGVNETGVGDSCPPKSFVLGKRPSAPTTWSSTTTIEYGKKVILYWAHNSEDSSIQEVAQLNITYTYNYGSPISTTLTFDTPTLGDDEIIGDDNREPTDFYVIDTNFLSEGDTGDKRITKIEWKVRTAGILKETNGDPAYGPWSIVRTVDVFSPPLLALYPVDAEDKIYIEAFPYNVAMEAGPENQDVLSYHLSIISASKYTDYDPTGSQIYIGKGQEVFSFDYDPPKDKDVNTDLISWTHTNKKLIVKLNPNDVNFAANMTYTVSGSVTMSTGLTAYKSYNTTVHWSEAMDGSINGSVYIRNDQLIAEVTANYRDTNGNIDRNVYLNFYRRTFDGKYLPLETEVENLDKPVVIDPHPPLDYASYRITAISRKTGAVKYTDLAPAFVGEIFAVIQWDEEWPTYYPEYVGPGSAIQPAWQGTMLKLPWNLDISDNWSPQFSAVEYIGREHPVGYYGTQEGHTASWKIDVVKADREMVAKLRRLATYKGNVYVREPYGSGYWAMVKVSFSQNHTNLVVPVTLDITRVEGGI